MSYLDRKTALQIRTLISAIGLTITVISLSLGVCLLITPRALPFASNIDPCILTAVRKHKLTIGYAVVKACNAWKLPPADKSWRFGDYIILRYTITKDNLQKIAENSIYVYAYRNLTIIDPIGFMKAVSSQELRDSLEKAKTYTGDAKRAFHNASTRWTGKGVVVCVIDSGVDYLHPDLRNNILMVVSMFAYGNGHPLVWINGVNGSWNEAYEYELQINMSYGIFPWLDLYGHGTHVSGIIAGSGNASNGLIKGLAPDAKLIVIKAFNDDGTSTTDIVLDALSWVERFAKEYNITVVNMSFGALGSTNGKDPLSIACDQLADQGLILFASAGNDYAFPFTIAIPACARKVIAIGAIDPYTSKIPSWTSIGPTDDGRIKPDFICAGVWVLSTKPITVNSYLEQAVPEAVRDQYYMWLSGTSMSCAVASGLCAEYIEWYYYVFHKYPNWREIVLYFQKYSQRINILMKDFISGWGIPKGLPS